MGLLAHQLRIDTRPWCASATAYTSALLARSGQRSGNGMDGGFAFIAPGVYTVALTAPRRSGDIPVATAIEIIRDGLRLAARANDLVVGRWPQSAEHCALSTAARRQPQRASLDVGTPHAGLDLGQRAPAQGAVMEPGESITFRLRWLRASPCRS
jgi:hypothetical protein